MPSRRRQAECAANRHRHHRDRRLRSTAAEALSKLPAAVTFALSSAGGDLERLAGKARGLGHELLLQVPPEPPESVESNLAPQGLSASLSPEQNIERLHWQMSRFQGYVGIANQMGAPPDRFGSGAGADPARDRQSRADLRG